MNLFDEHPRPWRIEQDETVDPNRFLGGYSVFDANGVEFMYGGTYTGDGDAFFMLNRTQVAELVALVNAAQDNSAC
jgi:hypothetical protein